MSGFGTLETAIEAVRAGAFDYISKPFDIGEIKKTVQRALDQVGALTIAQTPAVELPHGGIIGRSPAMLAVYKQIARAADSVVPVLILGESGTGKELVARALHRNSQRAARPCVAINCGALTDTLLESELFGHTRGAFTGAIADAKGIFEQAHGGTVFLDEIGETSPALQVKLLRVLEEGEVRPGRRDAPDQGGQPRDRRHQPRSGASGRAAAVPRRPLLPPQRDCDSRCRRCASGATTSRCSSPPF